MLRASIRRDGVQNASAEFDGLGRVAFLERYGFSPARAYFLVHGGRQYDSKAVVAEPRNGEEWQAMQFGVATDCILTALIAMVYWRANGLIAVDQAAMLHNVADWCARNRCVAEEHIEPLIRLRTQMLERIGAELDEAA